MNPGDKVKTPLGPGIIVKREGDKGILGKRFLVNVDPLIKSTYFHTLHAEQGGLYFLERDLESVNKSGKQLGLHF